MVHLLNAPVNSSMPQPLPPQRKRVIVIGAGAAGMAAAFHLGEHCLLLEQRQSLENPHDHPNNFPLGAAWARTVGDQDRGADGQRPGVSRAERQAILEGASAGAQSLKGAARWEPPNLGPEPGEGEIEERAVRLSVRALAPLLRGEIRWGAAVVRIVPSRRLVEVADGTRFVYDKLLSTMPILALVELMLGEIPWRIRCDETLRYWLNARDIELADFDTRRSLGDVDQFAAGKRVAELIKRALAEKFGPGTAPNAGGRRLFEPRVVMR